MVAVEEQFPHEKQEAFQLACEAMKTIAKLPLDALPGEVGQIMENATASAFSEMVSALAHDNPDSFSVAVSELDLAGGCLEIVRVYERLRDDQYTELRDRLLRWRQKVDELWEATFDDYQPVLKEEQPS